MSAPADALSLVEEASAFGASRIVAYPNATAPAAEVAAWTCGKHGGTPVPDWVGEAAYIGGVRVQTAAPARIWPKFGMVADAQGQVFRSTAGEVLTSGFTLADFEGDAPAETLGPVAVYLPFGSQFNYGHFLLDGLTSLQALDDAGALAGRSALSDPLLGWRKELVELAFPDTPRLETGAALVAAESAAFADSMDHYLHRPGPAALRLRARVLDRLGGIGRPSRRIYISRRGSDMRLLVNEKGLEDALAARGFEIVYPETLSVRTQVEIFRGARVIVGATGAGLSNALFAGPQTCVIEILPSNFSAPWLRDLCHRVGCDWRGWFAPAPLTGFRARPYRRRPKLRFAWRLEMRPFLAWLDRQLKEVGG
jgi:capsular polysaccharide biosynthesis protein